MSETQGNPSEKPYDAATDPDSDPGQLNPNQGAQPDQAEGELLNQGQGVPGPTDDEGVPPVGGA